MKLSHLFDEYQHFERCTFTIKIAKEIVYPSSFCVSCEVNLESSNGFEANIATIEFIEIIDSSAFYKKMQMGSTIEVYAGYQKKETLVFIGYLHEVEVLQKNDNELYKITVTGLDVKGLMMLHKSNSIQAKKVVSALLREMIQVPLYKQYVKQIVLEGIDSCMDKALYLDSKSDYDAICDFAKHIQAEFFVDIDTLNFQKAYKESSIYFVVDTWEGIESIQQLSSIKELYGFIDVISCNGYEKPEHIKIKTNFQNKPLHGKLNAILNHTKLTQIDHSYSSVDELNYLAKAYKTDIENSYATLIIRSALIPELRCSKIVEVHNSIDGNTKKMYITKVKHVVEESHSYSEWEGNILKG